ncbi:hypothetical protein [Novosphingobium sp. JCM 18896]|uniref:hypothetical protein n=1 Tax=Novosphingobium sp. JCM 18896 TaxID=2989731 RepID=UPI0022225AF3|nr:hypothetical protein [Novosphingobium sp. JCM 18896]MCW1430816.1 hypothetical protein [Novosphingobium sp. JCM 18896]
MPLIARLSVVLCMVLASHAGQAQTATVASTVEVSRSLEDREQPRTLGPARAGAQGEPRSFGRVFVELTIVDACDVATGAPAPRVRCSAGFEPRWEMASIAVEPSFGLVRLVRQTVEY